MKNLLMIIILLMVIVVSCEMQTMGSEKVLFLRPFIESEYTQWRITGKYGDQRPSGGSGIRGHFGIDYAVPVGTSVIAPSDGIVSMAKWVRGYGNLILIDHGNGVMSRIAHISEFQVLRGAKVSRGQVVGYSGESGNALGRPHIHFEITENGKNVHPAKYIIRRG